MITINDVKEELVETISPFINGYPIGGKRPQFRKALTEEETQDMFESLYELAIKIGEAA